MPGAPHPPVRGRLVRRSFGLWFETAPRGALIAVGIPSCFVLVEGIRITSGRPLPIVPAGTLGLVCVAAFSVAIGVLFGLVRDWQQEYRPIGRITVDVWKAVSTGRLPDDADPAAWRPAVEWYASEFGRANASPAKLIGALAIFPIGGLLAFPHASFGWILLAVAVWLGIVILLKHRRVPRRLDALFAQLAEREARRADSID
ncbi:hypothetical protein ACMT9U_00320 [Clavibacter sp. Sh2036]|uniref:hypothetical protein n=1 Tax=Clavibacter sp. Sh2036 TaxID=3397677 RepID=UPI0039E02A09